MLLKNILKGMIRKPLTLIFCLLMLTAAMLLALFAAALVGVTTAPVPAEHLTVAVRSVGNRYDEFLSDVLRIRQNTGTAYAVDLRAEAKGYSAGCEICIPAPDERLVSHANFCILAVKVQKITLTDRKETYDRYQHDYELEIVQAVAMHEVYEAPDVGSALTMQLLNDTPEEDWAEEGKTYLICGTLAQDSSGGTAAYRLEVSMPKYRKWIEQEGIHLLEARSSGEAVPMLSELSGSLADFLNTEVGRLWQELVLPVAEVTYRSVSVIGTELPDSIRPFNMEETVIIEGAAFTAAQCEAGERVCLISEQLAQDNGYAVGDTMPLSLYWDTYHPTTGFFSEGEYRIVGIFRNVQAYTDDSRGVHPNTVYIPTRCMGEQEELRFSSVSFVMAAGQENTFENELKTLGYGGAFSYYSGPRTDDTLTRIALEEARAQWIADAASLAVLLRRLGAVLTVLAALVMMWGCRREIGHFYRIETAERVLFLHIFVQTLAVGAVSVGLSALIAAQAFPKAVLRVLHGVAAPDFADRLTAEAVGIPSLQAAMLGGAACILLCGAVFSAIGMKRSYHYEYREGSET